MKVGIGAEVGQARDEKLNQQKIQEATAGCCIAVPQQPDPKEVFLRRLDYAEDSLVRHLSAIREFRRTLNWASPEVFGVLQKLLDIESVLRGL